MNQKYSDVERRFTIGGMDRSGCFTVQNAFNSQPDIVPTSGSVGLIYPVPNGQDIMGRFYTLGLRARM
jgi:hypothetical protein